MQAVAETLNMDYTNALLGAMLKQKQAAIVYKAALYLRLSRDDNNGTSESMSIQSQRDLLLSYAKDNGYEVVGIYVDDGFSGTNYDRPDFKRMINDIKHGKVNMVITKDLSRLGRNYVMTGMYTDNFFPDHGVRFIAINDNVDTSKEENDITPFKNILNEWYAKDTSKKMRSMRQIAAKQGKFMGSMPAYGYRRWPANKHKLEIDEYSSKVVKRIFELFKNQESARHIADKLNHEKILSPQSYYYDSIGQENPFKRNSNTWSSATIISLLKREVYIGQMVQGKVTGKSYKSKQRLELPPDMWHVVENTHDAIIDIETWNAVQFQLAANRNAKPRKTIDGEISIFANILMCSDCSAKLTLTTQKRKTITRRYRCSRYLQHGVQGCTPHNIKLEILSAVVLADIKNNAKLANEDKDAFVQRLHQVSVSERNAEVEHYRKREMQAQKRLVEIDGLMQKTFEKNCAGLLPDTVMANLMSGYEKEKQKLDDDLIALRIEKLKAESQTADLSREIEKLQCYAEITELNRTIVTSLIKSIHISEPTEIDGEKQYEIEIRYKFQNAFDTKKKTRLQASFRMV